MTPYQPPTQDVLDALPYPAVVLDADAVIRMENDAWIAFGRENGKHAGSELGLVYFDHCSGPASRAIRGALDGSASRHVYGCHAPAEPRWIELRAQPLTGGGVLVLHVDITGEARSRRRLRDVEVAFVDTNTDGEALDVSDAWADLTGRPARDALGHDWLDSLYADDRRRLLDHVRRPPTGDAEPLTLDVPVHEPSSARWLEVRCVPDRDGEDWIGWRISFVDATVRVTAELGAAVDDLTGVANRRTFNEAIATEVGRDPAGVAVVFIDLDGFKTVNDELGHRVGDEVLRISARRLTRSIRPTDLLARYGGDEFVVLIRGAGDALDEIAARTEHEHNAPVTIDGRTIDLRASFGRARGRPDDTAASLMARADADMYERKAAGTSK